MISIALEITVRNCPYVININHSYKYSVDFDYGWSLRGSTVRGAFEIRNGCKEEFQKFKKMRNAHDSYHYGGF